MASRKEITKRQMMFAKEYLVDLNGARAAIAVGFGPRGAKVTACRLLAKPHIKEYIQEQMDKRASRVEVTADMVLSNIKEIACSKDYGPDMPIRASDVLKANELLGKHLKLFTEKVEVEGKVTLESLIVQSNEQEDEA